MNLPHTLSVSYTHLEKKTAVIPFLKCFSGLLGAFSPEEVIFMVYMAERTRLREDVYKRQIMG